MRNECSLFQSVQTACETKKIKLNMTADCLKINKVAALYANTSLFAVNVGNWVLEQGDVMPRLNKRILDAPATKRFLDLTDTTGERLF